MTESLEDLERFIGRTATATDEVTASPIARLAATLGIENPAPNPGDVIPVGWHGMYFLPVYGPDAMRVDGQSSGGGFMPPVPLARQRLRGDSFGFIEPLRVGDAMTRTTEITAIDVEEDDHGPVVHLYFRQTIDSPRGPAVTEDRAFFYFDADRPTPDDFAPVIRDEPRWSREIEPSAALLFRYSALRFNTHRVHYDHRFATEQEGLPGLMVHGTLISHLLLELCRAECPSAKINNFGYRTWKPVFDTGVFTIQGAPRADGKSAALWCRAQDGGIAMTAQATMVP
ncbi:MAG: acyl-CoA dehydrogenase [Pseudomonadota bacterium]|nr:acyl-CoA dehydrogenase [Pseudomonadota bacterium]